MQFPSLPTTLLLGLALHGGVNAAASSDDKTKTPDPCTVASASGSFYDLRPLSILPLEPGKKAAKGEKIDDWHARGYDYHDHKANFTLNICAPLIEKKDHFEGVDKDLWQNVSAQYTLGSKIYSIGQESSNLTLRGRRLVLQYTNGSPCGGSDKKRSTWDDDEEDNDKKTKGRRKSTIISFHCDKDPLATQATATFVGTDPDECSYHFEVLSKAACITAEPAKQSVGPGAVFGIIAVIAILVYFLGGVFYQRNVAHARGWRQLPNYSMWAGIGSFIKDIFIIATSSCARFMPSRRGYSALNVNSGSNGRGRNGRNEDENRLIDQLDEEWDD
ncbi:mannose 6-phosphate receptor domain-containing protein [Mollisia scopiformis]|uniref:Mannose 6-phosphate receptor domain-containing protein n=1 Tax=Mollisia scopiformis TaxID=149040 RepID=A0A194XLM4_MOLSC|nr:mannose 6-phosphate receptor domain-containing protein [Mollisia scopiformis]KUJ20984.1 mannose 6-phosphate receptor domain-containing protein [Mollisia scopiformis]